MQKRSQETHADLLSAALKCFAQTGYDATTVADICQAAGVSKGGFYHHFPTKQAVFLELLRLWLNQLDEKIDAIRQQPQEIPETFIGLAGLMQNVFLQAGGYLPMFLEFWTQASRDPIVWQKVIAPYHRYQGLFKAMIQEGIDQDSFQEIDPEPVSRVILALAVGLLLQGVLDPQGADWTQVTQQGMQFLMRGLTKEIL